jgi:hypothetical protein
MFIETMLKICYLNKGNYLDSDNSKAQDLLTLCGHISIGSTKQKQGNLTVLT